MKDFLELAGALIGIVAIVAMFVLFAKALNFLGAL